jgi:hypothetical protein
MSRLFNVRTTFRGRRWLRWTVPAGLISIALTTTLVAIPGPAQAAEPATQAVCHVDVPHVTVTPGFSATPAKGTGQSGDGATIRCVGTIRGVTLVGDPGPATVTLVYGSGALSSLTAGDTCLLGSGDGTLSAIVPTLKGEPITLTGPIHFGFLGPLAPFYGHFENLVYAGLGEALPDLSVPQDCLTTPLTKFSIRGQFGLKSL